MSIQSNINQLISLSGLLYSQTPMAAKSKERHVMKERLKQEGKTLQEKGKIGAQGIEDIYKNVQEIEAGKRAPYSETELENIMSRAKGYNKDIYDAVVAADNPDYSKFIDKSAFGKRAERSEKLKYIEGLPDIQQNKTSQIQSAKTKAADALNAKMEERKSFKNIEKLFSEDFIPNRLGYGKKPVL